MFISFFGYVEVLFMEMVAQEVIETCV